MSDSELLKSFVDQYRLHADEVKFWAPYFINNPKYSPDPDNFKSGPYKGKGTPRQLQSWVNQYAKRHTGKLSAEGWRKALVSNNVGIECSGFVYYVLDSFLNATGRGRLWDQLFISKAELLKAFDTNRAPKTVLHSELVNGPNQVSLHQFCQQWGKDPRKNTNVARLLSAQSTVSVACIGQANPGDILATSGPGDDHIGIIIEATPSKIVYADSIGYELKGITTYQIKISNPAGNIEDQDWGESSWYKQRYDFNGLRRLKVLASD